MLFPAQWHIISKTFLPLLFLSFFLLFIAPGHVYAQTASQAASQTTNEKNILLRMPNFNPDVPLNQHTFVQAAMIEIFSAAFCIITDIDPINPGQGCLDIDTQTNKLGLRPPQDNQPHLNGIIGIIPAFFEQIYTPPLSSSQYISYLKDNFGIIKPVYADSYGNFTGFEALTFLLNLWKTSLNIAYFFLVIVFITIGLAIMLRLHIDPRTVMTIQNQIPRIIVCMLLTTFSFAIAGLMIDLMWVSTYVGINLLTQTNSINSDPRWNTCRENVRNRGGGIEYLMSNPPRYIDSIVGCTGSGNNGLVTMTTGVSQLIGDLVKETMNSLLSNNKNDFGKFLGWVATFFSWLIIIISLIIASFKTWWMLLKAYILVIIYVITAPIMIMMGLLPGKPLGFEKWLRRMFVSLIVFPATALLICAAALLVQLYGGTSGDYFVPPLTGSPNPNYFGWLIAYGMIMITPHLLEILQQNLHATSQSGQAATKAVLAGTAAGAARVSAVGGGAYNALTKTHPYTSEAQGPLAKWAVGGPPSGPRNRILMPILRAGGWNPPAPTNKAAAGGGEEALHK